MLEWREFVHSGVPESKYGLGSKPVALVLELMESPANIPTMMGKDSNSFTYSFIIRALIGRETARVGGGGVKEIYN